MKFSRRMRQRMPLCCNPIPTGAPKMTAASAGAVKLRAALTRYERKHGADELISFMKIELERRGEKRFLLDKLAPKPGIRGQFSLLDSGR